MRRVLLLALPLGLLAFAFAPNCGEKPLSIGTFNIRMFPEENTDRGRLVELIVELNADAFSVQEIRHEQALLDVLARASRRSGRDYQLALGSCGSFRTGVVYDTKRFALFATRQYREHDPEDRGRCDGAQPAFLAVLEDLADDRARLGLLAIHLKSGGSERDFEIRRAQWPRVMRILQAAETQYDAEIIALGDTNSTGWGAGDNERRYVTGLVKDNARQLPTGELACTMYWRPGGTGSAYLPSTLDHVVTRSERWGDAKPLGMCSANCEERAPSTPMRDWHRVSDHCPVRVDRR